MMKQKLKKVYSKVIFPSAPYNFDYSVHNPSHFPAPVVHWESGKLWFSFRFENKLIGIKFTNQGITTKPEILVEFYYKDRLDKEYTEKLLDELDYKFEFNKDYSEFYNKFKEDKLVGKAIEKFSGMKNFCIENLYEYLMIAILLQNTNVKRTVNMTKAMLENYGDLIEFDNKKIYSIWTPKNILRIPEQELRNLKVGYRAKNFLRASEDYLKMDKIYMRKLMDNELKKELLKIYGVGPASVDYIMDGVYHRKILNVIPPWESKIYSKLLKLKTTDTKEIMNFLDKNYGKDKSLVIKYLFMDLAWKHKLENIEEIKKLLPYT